MVKAAEQQLRHLSRDERLADELVAVAERRTLAGRTGLYDARVETAGRVVAEVRGRVRMPRETR